MKQFALFVRRFGQSTGAVLGGMGRTSFSRTATRASSTLMVRDALNQANGRGIGAGRPRVFAGRGGGHLFLLSI
uniref:Transferred entry: 7.1.2.2 n=1 Tax=Globodera pallida TaxID=36090 RepID=A0A183BND8_GLOPA